MSITHEAQVSHRHDVLELVLNLSDKLAHLEGKFHLEVYDGGLGGSLRFIPTSPSTSLLLLLHRSTLVRVCRIGRSRRLTAGSKMQNQSTLLS